MHLYEEIAASCRRLHRNMFEFTIDGDGSPVVLPEAFSVLNGKVMRKVGVEVVGLGAIKLTGFLRELMQRNNMNFESLYTVRTLKEEPACAC
ncbi:hypothetical protein K1719_002654 [Acacia pycnantha]|nr:hypothetical protein K1719_002654 [Acacia pycnantha]